MVEGEQFAGYRAERLLGEGGMARVFRAYDPRTDRSVALKVLKDVWREDPSLVERFLDEAKKNGPLNHPNIVRVHRVEATPQPFIDMELVEGPTLGDHVRARGGRLPADEVSLIGRDLASALQHAHRLGRVHRDVKPGNVMMAEDGRTPKLVDFGIAVIDGPEATRLTRHGEMIGTPRYMAPEQVRGERVDGRTDLFALGSVLYELLAGRPAVGGDSLVTVTNRILTQTPPPVRELAPGTPPALAAAVARMMAKDPAARFADAGAARAALEEALSQSSRGIRSERGAESGAGVTLPPRRQAARWVGLAAALVVLAALGSVGYLLLTPPSLAPQPPVVAADTAETTAGVPVTVPVLANDRSADGQPLQISAASVPSGQGTVRVEDDALVYHPGAAFVGLAAGQSATVALTYEASDPAGARGEGQVTVTVRGASAPTATPTANRPPLIQDLEHVMSAADQQAAIRLGELAIDPDGDPLTFAAPAAPRDGPGEVAIAGDLLLFTPGTGFADLARGERRTVTVPVTARDPGGLESRADVRITVTGVAEPAPGSQPTATSPSPPPAVANRPPEAGDLNAATAADAPLTVELATLARDPDGDPLQFSAPPAPAEGAGSVAIDGNLLLFDPGPGFADLPRDRERTVTVPVTARDPAGLEAHANLRVTVTGVGLPPAPEPDLRAAVTSADQLIRSAPCARLEMDANGGDPRVLLAASDSSLEPRVAEVLRQGAAASPDVRFAALPGGAVACGVFDLINATTTPEPARFVQLQASVDGTCDRPDRDRCYSGVEGQVLAEGERLVLSVDPPAGTPYLVVDYFMTDGSVAHLYPPHAADEDLVTADRYAAPAPHRRVVIGDSRAGKDDPNEYPVGPPFGHELVIAVAAAAPLFDKGRPFVEPAGDYLSALRGALASPPGGVTPKAAAVWLETMADHR